MPNHDVLITAMLSKHGIRRDSQPDARQHFYEIGMIGKSPNRDYIADYKVNDAIKFLREAFFWHCSNGDCRQKAKSQDTKPLLVERFSCMYCRGSNDARELMETAEMASELGINRILVVGGSDVKFRNIKDKSPRGLLEWEYVDGTKSPKPSQYKAKYDGADLIVIWSHTPLDHKVSDHFDKKSDVRVVTVTSTGITALARGIRQHLADGREGALAS